MRLFPLCAALLLTALSAVGQGAKIQWATTNTGPVVSNIVVILSSNLQPNRLSSPAALSGLLRVYAATNGNATGFWLDPALITPGTATNVYFAVQGTNMVITTNGLAITYNAVTDTNIVLTLITNTASGVAVAAGNAIVIVTNGNLRTISTTALTNGDTRGITIEGIVDINNVLSVDAIGAPIAAFGTTIISGGLGAINGNNQVAGTFFGNGAGLTNINSGSALTNVPHQWIPVSSRGIINGLSTVANAGLPYGPDTPGTATCGIQEAYNEAVAGKPYIGPLIVSVPLVLDGGDYFFTNALVFSNRWTTSLSIQSQAEYGSSRLIYAGTNTGISTITVIGGFNDYTNTSLTLPMGVRFNGLTFTAIHDTTNILVRLTNNYHVDIEYCNFTSWMVMTNQDWGSGNSIVGNFQAPPIASSLVGLLIGNGGENGTFVNRCNFGGIGVGMDITSDHIYSDGCTYSLVGLSWDLGGVHTSKWPTNHPYSTGAAILLSPGLNNHFTDPYFYSCRVGVFVNYTNPTVTPQPIWLDGPLFEGADFKLATTATNTVRFFLGGTMPLDTDDPTSLAYVNTTNGYSMNNFGKLRVSRAVFDNNAPDTFGRTEFDSLISDDYIGNGANLTNLNTANIPAPSTSTNVIMVLNSGVVGIDGQWRWNAALNRYTNATRTDVAVYMDAVTAPPAVQYRWTNAASVLPDGIANVDRLSVSNVLSDGWENANADPILNIFAYFSAATNTQNFLKGRLDNLRLLTATDVDAGEDSVSGILMTGLGGAASLPSLTTNAGRVMFVKNGPTASATTLSGVVDGISNFTLTNALDGVLLQAMDGQWRVIARYTTNVPASSGGSFIASSGGTGNNIALTQVTIGGLGLAVTNSAGSPSIVINDIQGVNAGALAVNGGNIIAAGTFTGNGSGLTNLQPKALSEAAAGYMTTNGVGATVISRNAGALTNLTGDGIGLTNLNQSAAAGPRTNYYGPNSAYAGSSGNAMLEVGSSGFWSEPAANGRFFHQACPAGFGYRTNIVRVIFISTNSTAITPGTCEIGQASTTSVAAKQTQQVWCSGAAVNGTASLVVGSVTNYHSATAQTNTSMFVRFVNGTPPSTNFLFYVGIRTEWYP